MPENLGPAVDIQPSTAFKSYLFDTEVNGTNYIIRILKMTGSLFIYIGSKGNESLNEIGVAMPVRNDTEIIGTTAVGPQLGCDSEDMAKKLAKRFKKQIYISCNVEFDRMVKPLFEKRLSEIIKENPDCF